MPLLLASSPFSRSSGSELRMKLIAKSRVAKAILSASPSDNFALKSLMN
jgi:hypothetical protein